MSRLATAGCAAAPTRQAVAPTPLLARLAGAAVVALALLLVLVNAGTEAVPLKPQPAAQAQPADPEPAHARTPGYFRAD